MSPLTQLTIERKRNMLVVGFRSSKIKDETHIATVVRELFEIHDLAASCKGRILLNFRGVECVSSAMIGKIVLLKKKTQTSKMSLGICNLAPEIMRIFQRTSLDRLFSIVDYQEDAEDDDEGLQAFGCRRQGDPFRFAPELFQARSDVIMQLSSQGFDWLSHYSSVDLLHDSYGIEVGGIHRQEDASAILKILIGMFPDWKPG